jgi:hypothetical protein
MTISLHQKKKKEGEVARHTPATFSLPSSLFGYPLRAALLGRDLAPLSSLHLTLKLPLPTSNPLLQYNTQVYIMLEAALIGRDVVYSDTDVTVRGDFLERYSHSQAYIAASCECPFPNLCLHVHVLHYCNDAYNPSSCVYSCLHSRQL